VGFGWFTPQTNTELGRRSGQVKRSGVEATLSSRGLRRFTTKPSGSLIAAQSQDRRISGRRWDPGAPRSFDAGDTQRDCVVCVGRTRTAAKAWPPDGNIQVLTKLPLRGVYLPLSCRGNVVILLHRRDFIYIALGLDGNSSIWTAS
jgi:hypothetical protein